MTETIFLPGERVRKVGGNYQADGIIRAAWPAHDGTMRYVFEFEDLKGMYHIFSGGQLRFRTGDVKSN